jgi:hypothetical protein
MSRASADDARRGAVIQVVLRAVIVRPGLWGTALRQVVQLAPRGWWRRWPFLPLPDRDYLAFRMQTAYGSAGASPTVSDVTSYLTWCRVWPRVTRRAH